MLERVEALSLADAAGCRHPAWMERITHRGADGVRGNAPRWVRFGVKYQF